MTIKEAQELVVTWNEKHSIRNSELSSMALLTQKVGELASAVARKQTEITHLRHGEVSPLYSGIAEVFWELLSMAGHSGIDLTEAIIDDLEKRNK